MTEMRTIWPRVQVLTVLSVYNVGAELNATLGNHDFAEDSSPDAFLAIYIGQTSDLSERYGNHDAMPCIECNPTK
jgi:hypothetical protein